MNHGRPAAFTDLTGSTGMLACVILMSRRLALLPLTREMMTARLAADDAGPDAFELTCDLGDGSAAVRFPMEWPGDALAAFPYFLASLGSRESVEGSYVAVDRAVRTAVGQLGTKGAPDQNRSIEIGYGFNPSVWGRGYTTEAVEALVTHLLGSGISTVRAETATTNLASQRVLEKNGFVRTGTRWDNEDGDLILWSRGN
jgi:RimJ/RimL family protein N-acetyltransferase